MNIRSAIWIGSLVWISGFEGGASGQEVIGVIEGTKTLHRLGQSMATVGDQDGDGFREYVVSSPGASGATGRVEVYSGKTQTKRLQIEGTEVGAEYGFSIAGIGDVNLDGFPDLVVGTPWSSVSADSSGRVEVRSGKDGGLLGSANGSSTGAYFGFAVSGAGDLNGDGREDILVGSPGVTSSAWVISGATQASMHKFTGAVASATGSSVSGGKDVTGDGIPDLLIGSSTEAIFVAGVWGFGKARVYSGANYALVHELLPIVETRFGDSALLIGDLNGDAKADVVVGAAQVFQVDPLRYRFEVFSGADGSHLYSVVGSVSPKNDVGFTFSELEDVTGDGVPDIISGAPNFEATAGSPRGAVHVYDGATGALHVTINGDGVGDQYGHGVVSAGDVNEDGFTDVLVGAPLDDDGGSAAGRAFVLSLVDVPIPNTPVLLGDKIYGTTSIVTKGHRFSFAGVKGSTFKLKASGGGDAMVPRFTLKNHLDQTINTWTIPSNAWNLKLSSVLPYSGDFALEVDGAGLTFGTYSVKTNRKLPESAKDQKKKLKGLPSHKVFFDGLPNGSASIKVKPVGGPDEFSIRLLAPSGSEIDVSQITITQASGKVIVPSIVMPEAGTYTLEINGIVDTKKLIKVTVKLFQPKGAATYIIDG